MPNLHVIPLIFALVLFILSALGVPSPPRLNLQSLGLAFATAAFLF